MSGGPNGHDPAGARPAGVPRWLVAATGLAGIGAFWCGLVIAAANFPVEYDWRYMTVSSLLSVERNPAGHGWAAGGIFVCGCLGLASATLEVTRSRRASPSAAIDGLRALQLGYGCTALAAGLAQRLLPLPKTHEVLAIVAFAALSIGIVRTFLGGVAPRLRSLGGAGRFGSAAIPWVVLSPVVLAVSAQAYVFFVRPELPWVNLSWRARGVPPYLSFAFWEWLTCGVLAAYVAVFLLLPALTATKAADDASS